MDALRPLRRLTIRARVRWPAGLLVAALACATPTTLPSESARNGDDLLVVDCLLPGQVRKMGSGVTYMTPRRPIKTSARDCEIRGGEYVAFDRASYADALRIWLPKAKEGDAQAQTYVGEIFEKGLGIPADHAAAAEWYRRAAEQGYGAAQINLGQLYELGLGVEKDPQQALTWYRRAAGLEDLDAAFVSFVGDAKQYQQLRKQLDAKSQQVKGLRTEVASLNRKLGAAEEQRTQGREAVVVEDAQLDELRATLAAESRQLAERQAAFEKERRDLEKERQDLARKGEEASQLRVLEAALDRHQQELDAQAEQMKKRAQEIEQRARENAERERELLALEADIQQLKSTSEAQLARYAQAVQPAVAEVLPGPSIQIVDPELVLTRSSGEPTLAVRSRERTIVGRVDAPGGLLSLVVNDVDVPLDPQGFFQTELRVRSVGTPVRIVAIDQQGKRASKTFILRLGEGGDETAAAPVKLQPRDSGIEFGRYHALVIGNGSYRYMPELLTAKGDARAVAALLQGRYGFKVKTLLDADRYQILAALSELREQLGEKDNLLVYYAGHGEYDKLDQRGYWLPVDAETDSRTNWIPNQAITDMLNAMAAKHVLVVADSCYSGALTEGGIPRVDEDLAGNQRASWQSLMVGKRSRTALTSGGLSPVLDSGGGEHSIFADAFLDILEKNDDVLDGRRLYEVLAARVTWKARTRSFRQEPEYAPMRFGGHEAGDFFLVPKS